MRRFRFHILVSLLAAASLVFALRLRAPDTLPHDLDDSAYWQLIGTFSESGGEFHSENYLSNETGFQTVLPALEQRVHRDGVYMGVGPEQNFTYIATVHPKIAFIIDIRRGNMLEHLIYKALFEMSPDRADFLSRLFSRTRPAGLSDQSSANELFDSYRSAVIDNDAFAKNLQGIEDLLVKKHKFSLTVDDLVQLEQVYGVFRDYGPEMNYNSGSSNEGAFGFGIPRGVWGRGGQRGFMPSYADLMTATDSKGVERSYLANEENYRFIRDLEGRNLVVPLVGDFGGDKTIRAVGRYLKERRATVSVFYLSNVERYLFTNNGDQNGGWKSFYENVGTLPVDLTSTFIRSGGGRSFGGGFGGAFGGRRGGMGVSVLASIPETLAAVKAGRIQNYNDVFSITQ
jgi:hypothetical protein